VPICIVPGIGLSASQCQMKCPFLPYFAAHQSLFKLIILA